MPLLLTVDTEGVDAAPDQRTLARIGFGHAHEIKADPRSVVIGQPAFLEPAPVECWRSLRSVETGRHGEIAYASDGHFLFGHVLLEETPGAALETIAYHAYKSVLDGLRAFGCLHLLRVWNILQAINQDQDGLERYQSFCVGRARAFADQGFEDRALPAASGVGSAAPGLMISFLAAPDPGLQVENPRQVSAFRYPRRYGPKSPSFSRALSYGLDGDDGWLFISGTASIVGHETLHAGSLDKQFEETARNVEAVMTATGHPSALQTLRVYIRHERDAAAVIDMTRRHFGADLPIIPLESPICRSDLLLEIEGVAKAHPSA